MRLSPEATEEATEEAEADRGQTMVPEVAAVAVVIIVPMRHLADRLGRVAKVPKREIKDAVREVGPEVGEIAEIVGVA